MRIIVSLFLLAGLVSCGGGSYVPGRLADEGDLLFPKQTNSADQFWQMDAETRLYHFSQGDEDGLPVLIVHGGPGVPTLEPWEGLSGIKGYRFHYYHQRGCGESTRPFSAFESKNYGKNMKVLEEGLGLSRHLEDIEKIRLILGQEKIILIGHSFGGFIAALYAIEFPERVEKMILVEPADMLSFPPAHGGMNQIQQWLSEDENEKYEAFLKEYFNYKDFFKKTEEELAKLNQRYGDFYLRALASRYPETATTLNASSGNSAAFGYSKNGGYSTHAVYFSLGRKYDFRELPGELTMPVLVVHGAKDLYGPEAALEWAESFPRSVYNEFQNSSHFPFNEEPEVFEELVENFLNN
ncbi:MAG: alpha/beta fold hydrolase [Spirochaetales bacterium]|nr:alpha/beta fold hydrolase [Spirochaetales bacterium]